MKNKCSPLQTYNKQQTNSICWWRSCNTIVSSRTAELTVIQINKKKQQHWRHLVLFWFLHCERQESFDYKTLKRLALFLFHLFFLTVFVPYYLHIHINCVWQRNQFHHLHKHVVFPSLQTAFYWDTFHTFQDMYPNTNPYITNPNSYPKLDQIWHFLSKQAFNQKGGHIPSNKSNIWHTHQNVYPTLCELNIFLTQKILFPQKKLAAV